jgi:hypothetical protein
VPSDVGWAVLIHDFLCFSLVAKTLCEFFVSFLAQCEPIIPPIFRYSDNTTKDNEI